MKTGKEIKVHCHNKNVKCSSGAVENYKSPESIYINISTWVEPKEDENYRKVISNFNRGLKQLIREKNLIDNKYFSDYYIMDMDLRESGMSLGKRSFMSIELNLYQNNGELLPLISKGKSKDLVKPINKLVNDIIESDLFVNNNHLNFHLTKTL